MNNYIKCFLASAFCGIIQSLFYLGLRKTIYFSDIIIEFGFPIPSMEMVDLMRMSMSFFPLFLFQMLFGTYIYRHFCSASVYYLSRCENRVTWFLKEVLSLYPFMILYIVIMVLVGTLVAEIANQVIYDRESLLLFIYYILIHSLWLFITTLLMNIIAIKLDSGLAFIFTVGIQLSFILLILFSADLFPLDDKLYGVRNSILLQLNPASHLVLYWHSSFIETLDNRINSLNIQFDLNRSVILFILLSVIIVVIGTIIVKKQDLILTNNETGGVG
jgi:hypothetical protein